MLWATSVLMVTSRCLYFAVGAFSLSEAIQGSWVSRTWNFMIPSSNVGFETSFGAQASSVKNLASIGGVSLISSCVNGKLGIWSMIWTS